MSSKMGETDMKPTSEGVLVPKLRFPEFREAGEWEEEPLGQIYSFKSTNTLSRDKLNYEKGFVKNIHYGDIHIRFSTLFNIIKEIVPYINTSVSLEIIGAENYCVEGDMIFADASEDLEDVGKSIEIVHLNNEKLLSGLHTLLARQRKNKLIIGFGGYLFNSTIIREQIRREAQGAKVYGISAGRLSNIKICFPSNKNEQQKIADCLSSLDEIIAAQSQKLDALKAHKKGLLQELFPAEGETLPRLRFPEFREAGEWERKQLNELLFENKQRNRNFKYGKQDVLSVSGEYGCVNQIEFMGRSYAGVSVKDYHVVETGDIVYTKSPLKNNPYGIIKENKGKPGIVSTLYAVYRVTGKAHPSYLDHYFSRDYNLNSYLQPIVRKGAKNDMKVNNFAVLSGEILIPKIDEQQKISECLSSIDELITSQTQKLDALKAHKKGLLQQLFPSVVEVQE